MRDASQRAIACVVLHDDSCSRSIEQNALGVWVRESPSLLAFPFILYLHTLGLALLAGLSVGLAVWLLAPPHDAAVRAQRRVSRDVARLRHQRTIRAGAARRLSRESADELGVLREDGARRRPRCGRSQRTKRELAVANGSRRARGQPARAQLALLSLMLWAGTIFAGRLLAYTHHILLASEGF